LFQVLTLGAALSSPMSTHRVIGVVLTLAG